MFFRGSFQLVLVGVVVCASAQSHGDLRLVDSQDMNLGRVEIFFEDQWSTICDVNYGGVGSIVCYQLKQNSGRADHPGTNVRLMNEALSDDDSGPQIDRNSTRRIKMRDIDCGAYYSDPLDTTHILRCDYELVEADSKCTHEDDLAVYCRDGAEGQNHYNSEVRLVGGNFSSEGTLEVYHDEKWGNVCHDGFHKMAAETVCRQMGYTHARMLSSTRQRTSDTVWLSGNITCGGKSSACLSDCVPLESFNQTSCSDGKYVEIWCGFDPGKADVMSPGNAVMCSLRRRFSKTPAFFFAIMSVSSGLWAVSTGVIIVTAVCYSVERCPCYKMKLRKFRRRRLRQDFTYYSINK